MEKYKNVQFDKLHDSIYDLFEIDASQKQLLLLLNLVFDTETVPLQNDDIIDAICLKYLGMQVPRYGSTEDYKNSFYSIADLKSSEILTDLEYIDRINDEEN